MTASWSAGYVLDIAYTSGFYREISPTYLSFVAMAAGGVRALSSSPRLTYAELGCGQGFGTALLAAANPDIDFYGFDFNPAQISNARRFAVDAGLENAKFFDQSFEESAALPREALPHFDFIVLHGIYSWISEANRGFIVQFLRDRLKPGGIVYVSYNCMPGWASAAPLQRLMREHANRHADRSDRQVEQAMAFAARLKAGGVRYFLANPGVSERLVKLNDLNRTYLAHEYLNGYWCPLYFLDVARELEPARLSFACSATITENIDALSIPAELQELASEITDRSWLETLKDYAGNRQFRRDIFMRGLAPMNALEQADALAQTVVRLTAPPKNDSFEFKGPLGEIQGHADIYLPLYAALRAGGQTLEALHRLDAFQGKPFSSVLQAVLLLVHESVIMPERTGARLNDYSPAARFNLAALRRLRTGEALGFLAAPRVGTGIVATYVEQLTSLARFENPEWGVEQIVEVAWSIMAKTNRRLVRDGRTLETPSENVAELKHQIESFLSQKCTIWQELGVFG